MPEILVLAEHDGALVKRVTIELLTLARGLGEPAVVWTGPGAEAALGRLAEFGAAKVYVAASPDIDDYVVASKAEVLARLAEDKRPGAVLVAATQDGREVAGRLAVKTGWGVLTDVTGLSADLTTEQQIFGGAITVQSRVRTGVPIIAVRRGAVTAEAVAVNRRDERLGKLPEGPEEVRRGLLAEFPSAQPGRRRVLGLRPNRAEVESGRERPSVAAHHDAPDRRVVPRFGQGRGGLGNEVRAEQVQLVRPVEHQCRDAAGDFSTMTGGSATTPPFCRPGRHASGARCASR